MHLPRLALVSFLFVLGKGVNMDTMKETEGKEESILLLILSVMSKYTLG